MSEVGQGHPALPPDPPLPAARLSASKGNPSEPSFTPFLIFLSHKHLLSIPSVLGTGYMAGSTLAQATVDYWHSPEGFPLQQMTHSVPKSPSTVQSFSCHTYVYLERAFPSPSLLSGEGM